jgi:hypothetical protein
MVDLLWKASGGLPVVPSDLLYIGPIRKQPGFEIVLRDVGMKPSVNTNPCAHLCFCIDGIVEIICARVDVCQSYDRIRTSLADRQQIFDHTPELGPCRYSAVIEKHIELRHPTR